RPHHPVDREEPCWTLQRTDIARSLLRSHTTQPRRAHTPSARECGTAPSASCQSLRHRRIRVPKVSSQLLAPLAFHGHDRWRLFLRDDEDPALVEEVIRWLAIVQLALHHERLLEEDRSSMAEKFQDRDRRLFFGNTLAGVALEKAMNCVFADTRVVRL